MDTPGGLDRWISFELGRINAGLVTERKSLAALRNEIRPACRTREGDEHPFDPEALERLASVLTPDEQQGLRLPVTLFISGDRGDEAYLTDPIAAKALRDLEEFGSAFPLREGRMHVPHSLALEVVRKSGRTLQLAFG